MRLYSRRGPERIEYQHNAFDALWCQACAVLVDDPEPPGAAVQAIADTSSPLVHATCGEPLALLACIIHPASTSIQRDAGGVISYVATLDALAAAKRMAR